MSNEILNKFKENWHNFKNQAKECVKEIKNKETRKKQIPNMFTASRLLAPFFIIPTALTGNILLTIIFSICFALTDAADGYYARKYNASSEFGRKLDPITDKVFAGSLLIPLIAINPLILINLIGEIVIALINTHSQFNENTPKTVFAGKIKTTVLYSTIALSYISLAIGNLPLIINSFIGTTALLQVITAKKYYSEFKKEELLKKIATAETNYQKELIENEEVLDKNIEPSSMTKEKIQELGKIKDDLINYNKPKEEHGFQNIKRKK